MPADLTRIEKALSDCAARGEALDVTGNAEDERRVRASVIYSLCTMQSGVHARGVRLAGAMIEGPLDLESTTLVVPLVLTGCVLGDPARPDGIAVNLQQATATRISLIRCRLHGSLYAAELRVDHAVSFAELHAIGPVMLRSADINGTLSLSGARLVGRDESGFALLADRLKVGGSLHLNDGFRADGVVSLIGVDVRGRVSMEAAQLVGRNGSGFALLAERLKVGGSAHLRDGFRSSGAVTLLGADINGTLSMTGATLAGTDERGRSLLADRLTAGGVHLDNGFSSQGAVSLRLATITGDLAMEGAVLAGTDARGRSLVADGVKVGGGIYLRDRFTAKGAVDLAGARVDRRIDLTGEQPLPSLVLQDAQCSEFVDSESSWPPPGQLLLGGFRFTWLDDQVGWTRRLSWLRRQGFATWSSDPYEQLALYYTRTGDETAAREIHIAKHDDELHHLKLSGKTNTFPYRFWRHSFGWLLGYGYRRRRAGLILAGVIVAAAIAFALLNHAGTMVPNVPEAVAAEPCGRAYPCFNAAFYGADVVLPIIDFGQDVAWRPNSSASWGAVGEYLRWGFIAVGWILASIFVAAFTNLVRRD
jgi:hypothetical protein